MISRRKFFSTSAAASLVNVGGVLQGGAASTTMDVPSAIAALPSYAGRVPPFTNAERLARIEKAKALMDRYGVDAILLLSKTSSSLYFANIALGESERLWALVVPAKAKPFVVCPSFEEDRARELLSAGPFARDADVLTWEENENPFALTVKGLHDRGMSTGKIGVDENARWVFVNSLMKAGPNLKFVSATPVTAGCRMIKEPHEIACIRTAGQATLAVYEAIYRSLSAGLSAAQIEAMVEQAYAKVELPGEVSVSIDEVTASPHGSTRPQLLREGSIVMMDDGCSVHGYTSDITRTVVLGEPTGKMKQVFEIVRRAQQAGVAAARPGVVAGTVDRAARKVLTDAGYGPGFHYLRHRLGHGIGLDMHEWPYLIDNNMFGDDLEPRLQAGMVTSDEPGIYIPGEFGIRLEDEMHVTDSGAEFLTPTSPSLENPFGKA